MHPRLLEAGSALRLAGLLAFDPSDSFDAVFGVDVTLRVGNELVADPTLLEALQAQGGGINALMRHAVAALLNASNPDVDSDFTVAEVIALVREAIETGDIERNQEHPRRSERARVPIPN